MQRRGRRCSSTTSLLLVLTLGHPHWCGAGGLSPCSYLGFGTAQSCSQHPAQARVSCGCCSMVLCHTGHSWRDEVLASKWLSLIPGKKWGWVPSHCCQGMAEPSSPLLTDRLALFSQIFLILVSLFCSVKPHAFKPSP